MAGALLQRLNKPEKALDLIPVQGPELQCLTQSQAQTLLYAFTYGRGAWRVRLGS